MRKLKSIITSPVFWITLTCVSIGLMENFSSKAASFFITNWSNVPSAIVSGQGYRLFTSLFVHTGPPHLITNMIGLIALSWLVTGLINKVQYTFLLLISGGIGNLLADLFVIGMNYAEGFDSLPLIDAANSIVGLSTAIYGLFVFTIIIFPAKSCKDFREKKLKWFIFLIITFSTCLDLILGILDHTPTSMETFVHSGGAIVGGICAVGLLIVEKRRTKAFHQQP